MALTFQQTNLWKRAFEPEDAEKEIRDARDRLRVAYLSMRENVKWLVAQIHEDCKGLTVHDITHLDALWETADLIVGSESTFNAAEAFVLGGAILLHDAGMTVSAFRGGLEELKDTKEWREHRAAAVRREQSSNPRFESAAPLSPELEKEINFAVLREIHPAVAERLATQAWDGPTGNPVSLLEDVGLRGAFGSLIGRIAHSHHWDVPRLKEEFNSIFPPAIGLPSSWTINPIKVACALRCADAAHIDERRAPTMLYALSRPSGISDEHWSFQNKLNQAARQGDKLVYSAGEPFKIEAAPAWWRAYDTINMIDAELKAVSSVLSEISEGPFAAESVSGAGNPTLLSRYIPTAGWEPVNAEVRVSSPVSLARNLGGRNLYGNSPIPVIRELIQNSADAIRARRKLESREIDWGKIAIQITKDDSREGVWLHIDDNGIGMSKRILTTTLLDFGQSIWNSSILREEYPELMSSGISPIGKFGIGFFSVFVLADEVRVISRRFNDAQQNTSALQFSGLSSRPVLRKATVGELHPDSSTRISLYIPQLKSLRVPGSASPLIRGGVVPSLRDAIRSLVAALDVRVTFKNDLDASTFDHSPNWTSVDAKVFMTELYTDEVVSQNKEFLETHINMFRVLKDESGTVWGRAAFRVGGRDRNMTPLASVGGISLRANDGYGYVGVLSGETANVARSEGTLNVPDEVFSNWLQEQASLLCDQQLHNSVLVRKGFDLATMGVRLPRLPMCFFLNAIKTWKEFEEHVRNLPEISIPVKQDYDNDWECISCNDIGIEYATSPMLPEILVLPSAPTIAKALEREHDETVPLRIEDVGEHGLAGFIELLVGIWGEVKSAELREGAVFQGPMPGFDHTRTLLTLYR